MPDITNETEADMSGVAAPAHLHDEVEDPARSGCLDEVVDRLGRRDLVAYYPERLSQSAPQSTSSTPSRTIAARTDVQGTSDMAMALTAAGGGALAGVIVGTLGYPALAAFAALLAGAVVVAGRVTRRHS